MTPRLLENLSTGLSGRLVKQPRLEVATACILASSMLRYASLREGMMLMENPRAYAVRHEAKLSALLDVLKSARQATHEVAREASGASLRYCLCHILAFDILIATIAVGVPGGSSAAMHAVWSTLSTCSVSELANGAEFIRRYEQATGVKALPYPGQPETADRLTSSAQEVCATLLRALT